MHYKTSDFWGTSLPSVGCCWVAYSGTHCAQMLQTNPNKLLPQMLRRQAFLSCAAAPGTSHQTPATRLQATSHLGLCSKYLKIICKHDATSDSITICLYANVRILQVGGRGRTHEACGIVREMSADVGPGATSSSTSWVTSAQSQMVHATGGSGSSCCNLRQLQSAVLYSHTKPGPVSLPAGQHVCNKRQ